MSIQQCYKVSDLIEKLHKLYHPDDVLIIDWWTAEDIRDVFTDYGNNEKKLSEEQCHTIMDILDDVFDFGFGNPYCHGHGHDALNCMLSQIEEEVDAVLAS